jgi:putative permease
MKNYPSFSNSLFFRDWIQRVFPNSQAVSLAILLVLGFVLIYTLSDWLLPVFAAGVIAYLLEGIVELGEREHLPRLASVLLVYFTFLAFVTFILIALLPLLYQQTAQLVQQLPSMITQAQVGIMRLPEQYPRWISEDQINEIIVTIKRELISYGQQLLSVSASSLVGLVTLIVYLILVPLLVFFFMKDKDLIIAWFVQYLPRERRLSTLVWREVDRQIGNYVRGKFLEVLILGVASYITFSLMGLNYALLLSVFIGLSVIIPYVGATLITFPVIMVAYFQYGFTDDFFWVMVAYTIIQSIDGVVLVPLLFSGVVNLHPVAIIVSILLFGGLWGFWGVFFAIPLATLVQAVLTAWPRIGEEEAFDNEARLSASELHEAKMVEQNQALVCDGYSTDPVSETKKED